VDSLTSERFAVVYSDFADEGRVVLSVVELSETASLVPASPDFVITKPNPDETKDYFWVSSTSISDSLFAVVDALSVKDPNSPGSSGGKVSFYHTLNPPSGVAISEGKKGDVVDVVVSGLVERESDDLKVGKKYYTNTKGDLVTGYLSEKVVDRMNDAYVIVGNDNNTLLTLSAYVGIAIAPNKLLLKL